MSLAILTSRIHSQDHNWLTEYSQATVVLDVPDVLKRVRKSLPLQDGPVMATGGMR